jgi:hypothetical protein
LLARWARMISSSDSKSAVPVPIVFTANAFGVDAVTWSEWIEEDNKATDNFLKYAKPLRFLAPLLPQIQFIVIPTRTAKRGQKIGDLVRELLTHINLCVPFEHLTKEPKSVCAWLKKETLLLLADLLRRVIILTSYSVAHAPPVGVVGHVPAMIPHSLADNDILEVVVFSQDKNSTLLRVDADNYALVAINPEEDAYSASWLPEASELGDSISLAFGSARGSFLRSNASHEHRPVVFPQTRDHKSLFDLLKALKLANQHLKTKFDLNGVVEVLEIRLDAVDCAEGKPSTPDTDIAHLMREHNKAARSCTEAAFDKAAAIRLYLKPLSSYCRVMVEMALLPKATTLPTCGYTRPIDNRTMSGLLISEGLAIPNARLLNDRSGITEPSPRWIRSFYGKFLNRLILSICLSTLCLGFDVMRCNVIFCFACMYVMSVSCVVFTITLVTPNTTTTTLPHYPTSTSHTIPGELKEDEKQNSTSTSLFKVTGMAAMQSFYPRYKLSLMTPMLDKQVKTKDRANQQMQSLSELVTETQIKADLLMASMLAPHGSPTKRPRKGVNTDELGEKNSKKRKRTPITPKNRPKPITYGQGSPKKLKVAEKEESEEEESEESEESAPRQCDCIPGSGINRCGRNCLCGSIYFFFAA